MMSNLYSEQTAHRRADSLGLSRRAGSGARPERFTAVPAEDVGGKGAQGSFAPERKVRGAIQFDAQKRERSDGFDEAEFDQIYNEEVGRVYALCMRMTANPTRAQELTQESFVRAWDRRHQFTEAGSLGGWIRRVAINVVLSDQRRIKTRRESDLEAPTTPLPLDRPNARVDLEKAIQSLPNRARQIFVLHDVEGYRHREIADLLSISEGTSKSQLHRARGLLRQELT